MQVLFATTLHPGARSSGGERVSAAFVDALRAAGHRVTVLGYRRSGASLSPRSPEDLDVGPRAIETRRAGVWPVWWMVRALVRGVPYSAAKYDGRAYRRAFAQALARLDGGLVVIDHAQLSWLLELLPAGPRVVLLAHNVEHRLYAEQARGPGLAARINGREARRVLDRERALCARADTVWTLTAADRDRLAALGA
ncbi:MAG: glycosyltransferase, partial [Solirubrobacterales bacterium]|nr:glycosyltransferase [Solirubrobacterales bacterium]